MDYDKDINFPHYQQVQSVNDLNGDAFSKGTANFKWGNWGKQSRWNPYKSYFKLRVKITTAKLDVGGLSTSSILPRFQDQISPNMFLADNLFQRISQKVNDISVSEQSDYIAQVASLKERLKSKSWLDSVYKINFSEPKFEDRQNRIIQESHNSRRINSNNVLLDTTYMGTQIFDGATNTFSVAATGILSFLANGGLAIPDIRNVFQIGDTILYGDQAAVVNERSLTVTGFIDALTIQCASGNVSAVSAAQSINTGLFRVLRHVPKSDNESGINDFSIIWRPCLGFWQINKWLPSADYNFQITPHPALTYARYAIESLVNLEPQRISDPPIAGQFKVEIVSMLMYIYVGNTNKILTDISLTYPEARMQSQNLTTNTLTQKTFVINPNSYAITIAYADSAVGENTTLSRSKFKIRNDEEQNIVRFYVRRGSEELPRNLRLGMCVLKVHASILF